MTTTYVQPGEVLDLTAPTGGVTNGLGYIIGDLFVVANMTASAGAEFTGWATGVHSLPKTSAQAWTEGQKIYWDDTNKRADSAASVGPQIGVAVTAAANPSSTGEVKLLVGAGLSWPAVGEGPAQFSDATAGNLTYTAAQLLGGNIVRDPNGGARTDTLPTAALLVAAIPGARVGDIVRCYIVNGADAAETITLAAGSGGAFDTNQTAASRVIPQNASKLLTIRLTNVTAASEAYVCWA